MGTPTASPIASSSSSHSPSSEAETDTDVSSSFDTSGSDSDFNPVRVNFGPQKTPERRFLQKVRRRDSREFHRRQTINWGLEGEGRDRVERKEGDEGEEGESEQQRAIEVVDQEDALRVENGNDEEEEEEEDPSTPDTPSRSSPLHPSTRTTPAPAYRALPSLSLQSNPPSSPAYDGDADSEGDEEEAVDASYMDYTPTLEDTVDGGVDDSFDEVEQEEGAPQEDVDPTTTEPGPSSLSAQQLPLDEDEPSTNEELRLSSPDLPSSSDVTTTTTTEPTTLPSAPTTETALEPDLDFEEATFIDEAQEDSEWEDELPSRPEEELLEVAASEESLDGDLVVQEVLEVGVESRMTEEEVAVDERRSEDQDLIELVVSVQEELADVELEGSENLEAQGVPSPEVVAVESLERQGELEEPAVELELEVVKAVEEPELVQEEIIALASSDGSAEVEVGEEVGVDAKPEVALQETASSVAPVPELIAFDVSPEKEASPEPELTPATTTIPLLTPSKPVTSFLDSAPTPFHSLPLLLPTPTPILADTSQPGHQAEESFVFQSIDLEALPADSTLVIQEELVVAATLESEAEVSMVFDASIVSSVAPEVSISPSKSETTDEDVELGRCGPSGRKSVPLVVQILTSPSELSPPPSSDSDSSTSVSLAPLGTPTPSSSTARPISTSVAVPTPLRPTESQSSASSSTSATPPTHARKTAPIGPVEKRPAPKVLKRASPQKSAAAAEKEADRVARLRFRAQLDAAVSRTSGPSPMRSVSKPPPRPLDASTRTLGPSPRVGFVRTLARVTPSPTATSSTLTASVRPVAPQGRALGAPSSSAMARVITPQPLHRSKPAPPPSASTVRPAAKTAPLPATSVSAPAPPSSSRPVFGSRAAPPQPSSALKARPAGPPSAMKAPVSQLPKPSSSSGIPKPPSMLPKGPSARVPSSSSIGMAASSRAPVGGASSSARPKQALKTFGSWSSAGGPTSSVRRLGGDSSMSMPVSVGGGAFARGLESESSFRMDSSFRMESPRPSRPNLGEPVRVVSPAKGANGRTIPSSMSAGPIRMNSPIKSSSSSFASSLGPSSHFNRAPRDGPFASSSTSIFAQSASSSSFSENIKPPAPSPRKGQSFLASVEASISKAPTSLRDGKSLPASESSSSKEPSPVNETRASSSSSTSNEQASTALPPLPPAAAAQSISSPLSEIPSSPTRSNGSSSSNQTAPPPPPITRNASATTDASTTPGRSLRARREPEPQPPVASSSRPGPPLRTAASRAKKTNSSDPPPPEEMSVAQLKSFTLMNTTKNQVYFSAMEKVVVRKDGENRPSSPGEKVKKAGKEWEATAASGAGKKRKKPLFDAGDEFSSSEEEEEEERKTHVRGPGEEEDFFSPVKQSASKGGRGGGGKRSKGGAGIEEATTTTTSEASGSGSGKSKKEVKWDKGLVWIRARKNQPLELEVEGGEREEEVGSTRGRKPKKGCMRSLDRPLDHMGNLPPPLPALTEIIKRDKVTYTQLVYDDDVQAAAPAKKGKK